MPTSLAEEERHVSEDVQGVSVGAEQRTYEF